jgi:hypothetical protein
MRSGSHGLLGSTVGAAQTAPADCLCEAAEIRAAAGDPDRLLEAVDCLQVPADTGPVDEVLYLPKGTHVLTPQKGPRRFAVTIDEATAKTMEQHRQAVEARTGKRVYFDFNHRDQEASFWPLRFQWRNGLKPGVVAVGHYSEAGKAGVEGHIWREFSPRFFIDRTDATEAAPARVIVNPDAMPNFGGFVNNGAFRDTAIWAKASPDDLAGAAGDSQQTTQKERMNETELAALKAKQSELEKEVQALKATVAANETDELSKARLQAKESEARANAAEIQAAESGTRAERAEKEIKDRNLALGKVAIEAAKKRGAIPSQGDKGKEIEAKYLALVEKDGSNVVLIEALQGNAVLGHRLTEGVAANRIEGGFSAQAALKRYAEILARNTLRLGQGQRLNRQTVEEKSIVAVEAANFYKAELDPHFNDFSGLPLQEIMAATDADSLGTLAGTLVLQRSLPLFRFQFPVLGALYSDFSATPGLYNQTEETRVITVPAVQTYDPTVGSDGRPKGWGTVVAAQATDVPVKLDEYVGVPIVFSQATLAATIRRLFDEQGPAAIYAMAKYFVAKLAALFTPDNYNAYAVAKAGVPDAMAAYVCALKDFSMDAFDDLEAIFDANEVPAIDRGVLLNAKYHGKVRKDPRLGLFFAAMNKPDLITEGNLPKLDGFVPYRAPWLPTTNNLTGFAFHKSAAVLKQRLPTDFTTALNVMVPGSVTTVTDPESGLSCLLVQYINLLGNFAEWRVEALLGAAKGDKRGGLCITSG